MTEQITKGEIQKALKKGIIRITAPDDTGLGSFVIGDQAFYFGTESQEYETREQLIDRIGWENIVNEISDMLDAMYQSKFSDPNRLPERNQYSTWLYCQSILRKA